MINLGTIQLNQKMTGVQFVAQDGANPPNNVVSFNGLSLAASPTGIVSFQNQTAVPGTPTNPLDSTFTVDIVAQGLGTTTITATGQQGNGQPTFSTQCTITVVANPNAPGPPIAWSITPGTVVSQ